MTALPALPALRAARACIQQDRTAMADCCVRHDGTFEPDDAEALADYDAVLAQIDAALAEFDASLMNPADKGSDQTPQPEPVAWTRQDDLDEMYRTSSGVNRSATLSPDEWLDGCDVPLYSAPPIHGLMFDAAMPEEVAKWITAHPPRNVEPLKIVHDETPKIVSDLPLSVTPQPEPSEWVMVPREPTQEMVQAHIDSKWPDGHEFPDAETANAEWSAMIASAPQPPATSEQPVAWRLRNTSFRNEVYEYFKTKQDAVQRQQSFNMSCDDGGLYGLTPLFLHPPRSYEPMDDGDIVTMWIAAKGFRLNFARDIERAVLERLGVEVAT